MAVKRLTEVKKPEQKPADSRFDEGFGFHVSSGRSLKAAEKLEKQMRKSKRLRGH